MTKYLLLAGLLILAACKDSDPTPGSTLGSWKKRKDYTGVGRSNGNTIAFSLLGKGYFGMGGNVSDPFLRDVWQYDPAADSWTKKNDFPFDLPAVADVALGNKAYVLTYSGGLHEYNPETDSWKYLSSAPFGTRVHLAAFAAKGNLYFGTGNALDGSNVIQTKDFWRYNVSANTWTQVSDFPGGPRLSTVSFAIGDNGYVGLGFKGAGAPPFSTDMWRYDADKDEWSQVANFPSDQINSMAFASTTKGYVGVSNNTTADLYEYDPGTNAWRKLKGFPSTSYLFVEVIRNEERFFAVGGWFSDYSVQVYEFIP
jgi:N-acetylneuraminic acid mutarotase